MICSLLLVLAECFISAQSELQPFPLEIGEKNGSILIGAVFRTHYSSTGSQNGNCTELYMDGVIEWETFLYAMNKVNELGILPENISLGYKAYDICGPIGSSPLIAIQKALNTPNMCYGEVGIENSVVGINAFVTSDTTIEMQYILAPHCVPIVSSLATSDLLTNTNFTLDRLFARTVPANIYQAYALAKVVKDMKWKRIILLHDESLYATELTNQLKQIVDSYSCVLLDLLTSFKGSPETYVQYVAQIEETIEKKGAQAIVMIVGYFNAPMELFYAMNSSATTSRIRAIPLLGEDIFSASIISRPYPTLLSGAMGTNLWRQENEQFYKHLHARTIKNTAYNPLLQEVIAIQHNCSLNSISLNACNGSEKLLQDDYKGQAHLTFSAVDLLARAIAESCVEDCSKMNGNDLMRKMLSTNFSDSFASFHFFNGTNGAYPKFSILQFQNGMWTDVGLYEMISENEEKLTLNESIWRFMQTSGVSNETTCDAHMVNYWVEEKCSGQCYRYFMPRSAFDLLCLTLASFGIIIVAAKLRSTLFSRFQKEEERVPFTAMLQKLSSILFFIITILRFAAQGELICKVQKTVFSFAFTLGSLALALTAQGTKRANFGALECLGLIARNLRKVTLFQIGIALLLQTTVVLLWVLLNVDALHRFQDDYGSYYVCCSFLQPFYATYLYSFPLLLQAITFAYGLYQKKSKEEYCRNAAKPLLTRSVFFLTLSFGFLAGGLYSNFAADSYVGTENASLCLLGGFASMFTEQLLQNRNNDTPRVDVEFELEPRETHSDNANNDGSIPEEISDSSEIATTVTKPEDGYTIVHGCREKQRGDSGFLSETVPELPSLNVLQQLTRKRSDKDDETAAYADFSDNTGSSVSYTVNAENIYDYDNDLVEKGNK